MTADESGTRNRTGNRKSQEGAGRQDREETEKPETESQLKKEPARRLSKPKEISGKRIK